MKHFIIILQYTAPLERIDGLVDRHRQFLAPGYESGMFLMSGPRNPREGGIIVARAKSLSELIDFMAKDPYATEGVATYSYMEFQPVRKQSFLEAWISGQ